MEREQGSAVPSSPRSPGRAVHRRPGADPPAGSSNGSGPVGDGPAATTDRLQDALDALAEAEATAAGWESRADETRREGEEAEARVREQAEAEAAQLRERIDAERAWRRRPKQRRRGSGTGPTSPKDG